jgi:NAD(P)-dependent dehydrogenase (short-subunit alcohol dehydrogenase family)
MSRPLEQKVALVTGAARGIGRAIAVDLARLGADVVIAARTATPRDDDLSGTIGETAQLIEAAGSKALAVQADLNDPVAVRRLVETTIERFGGVDILVNNAADTSDNVFLGFWETSPEAWESQMQLNLNVMYVLMKAFAPGMRERGGGFIVNLGSLREVPEGLATPGGGATGAVHLGAAYPTSKVAIYTMTTLLAQELANDNIVAFTLNPGAAVTESFKHNANRFGFDPSIGTSVDLPVQALASIVTSTEPMQYAARYIDAVKFVSELPR